MNKVKHGYIIFGFLLLGLLSSCVNPNNNPTPPPPVCDFGLDGSLVFNEMHLEIPQPSENSKFVNDHDIYGLGYIDDFNNLMDFNNQSDSPPGDASITINLVGSTCDGAVKKVYENDVPQDYSFSYLDNAPKENKKEYVILTLKIKSAAYMNDNGDLVRCVWSKTFPEMFLGASTAFQTGSISGSWCPIDKCSINGKPVKVYVHDKFNQYIYSI